ncbi:MAG: Ig-like domain-containing protein [Parvibaculaceae bacterium]
MKKPLAIFVGAAVVALAMLIGLTSSRWQNWPNPLETLSQSSDSKPQVATKEPEPTPDAGTQQQSQDKTAPSTENQTAEQPQAQQPQTEQPAENQTAQAPEQQAQEPQKQAEAQPETAQQAPADQAPKKGEKGGTFDVVRVEENGEAVFAGRCDPHANVALLMDNTVIGSAKANELGEWLIVPDRSIPVGSHEFILESTNPNGRKWLSQQTLTVSVEPNKTPLIVLSEPDKPSKVLQKPDEQVATAPETSEPSQAEQPSATQEQAAKTEEPKSEEPKAPEAATGQQQAAKSEEPKAPEAATGQQQAAEASKSAETGGEQVAEAVKSAEEESGQASSQPSTGQEVAKTETDTAGEASGEAVAPQASQDAAKAPDVNLSLDTVDYNDRGDIIFSGKAKQGSSVRLYVDNQHVGDAVADAQGNWSFAGREEIVPGPHSLRADVVDAVGKVSQRIELPFQRADPKQVAVLQGERKTEEKAGEQQAPQPKAEEPKAEEPKAEEQKTAAAEQPEAQTSTRATKEPETPQPSTEQQSATQEPSAQEQTTTEPQASQQEEPQSQQAEQAPEVAQPQSEAKEDAASGSEQKTAAQEPAKEPEAQPRKGRVVIQPGNNLWRIARVIYGQGVEYTTIFEANKEQIRDPDLIYPGQIFNTPDVVPPEEIDPKRRKPMTAEELGNK